MPVPDSAGSNVLHYVLFLGRDFDNPLSWFLNVVGRLVSQLWVLRKEVLQGKQQVGSGEDILAQGIVQSVQATRRASR